MLSNGETDSALLEKAKWVRNGGGLNGSGVFLWSAASDSDAPIVQALGGLNS
jgi:hypothetical protein